MRFSKEKEKGTKNNMKTLKTILRVFGFATMLISVALIAILIYEVIRYNIIAGREFEGIDAYILMFQISVFLCACSNRNELFINLVADALLLLLIALNFINYNVTEFFSVETLAITSLAIEGVGIWNVFEDPKKKKKKKRKTTTTRKPRTTTVKKVETISG